MQAIQMRALLIFPHSCKIVLELFFLPTIEAIEEIVKFLNCFKTWYLLVISLELDYWWHPVGRTSLKIAIYKAISNLHDSAYIKADLTILGLKVYQKFHFCFLFSLFFFFFFGHCSHILHTKTLSPYWCNGCFHNRMPISQNWTSSSIH